MTKNYHKISEINENNYSNYTAYEEYFVNELKVNLNNLKVLHKHNESDAIEDLNDILKLVKILEDFDVYINVERALGSFLSYFYTQFIEDFFTTIFGVNYYYDHSILVLNYKITKHFMNLVKRHVMRENFSQRFYYFYNLLLRVLDPRLDYYSCKKYNFEDAFLSLYSNYKTAEKLKFISELKVGDIVDAVKSDNCMKAWRRAEVVYNKENKVKVKFYNYSSNCCETYNLDEIYKNIAPVGTKFKYFDSHDNFIKEQIIQIYNYNNYWEYYKIQKVYYEDGIKMIVLDNNNLNNMNAFSPLIREVDEQTDSLFYDNYSEVYGDYCKYHHVLPKENFKYTNKINLCKLYNTFFKNNFFDILVNNISNATVVDSNYIILVSALLNNLFDIVGFKKILEIKNTNIYDLTIKAYCLEMEKSVRTIPSNNIKLFLDNCLKINKYLTNDEDVIKLLIETSIGLCIDSGILEKQTIAIDIIINLKLYVANKVYDNVNNNFLIEILTKYDVLTKILLGHDFIIQKSHNIIKYCIENNILNNNFSDIIIKKLGSQDTEERKTVLNMLKDIIFNLNTQNTITILNILLNYKGEVDELYLDLLLKLQNNYYIANTSYNIISEIYWNIILNNEIPLGVKNIAISNLIKYLISTKNSEAINNTVEKCLLNLENNNNPLTNIKIVKEINKNGSDVCNIDNKKVFNMVLNSFKLLQNEYYNAKEKDNFKKENLDYDSNVVKRLKAMTSIIRMRNYSYCEFVLSKKILNLIFKHSNSNIDNYELTNWLYNSINKVYYFINNQDIINYFKIFVSKLIEYKDNKFINFENINKTLFLLFNNINIKLNNLKVKTINMFKLHNYPVNKKEITVIKTQLNSLFGYDLLWDIIRSNIFKDKKYFIDNMFGLIIKSNYIISDKYNTLYQQEYINFYNKLKSEITLYYHNNNNSYNNSLLNILSQFIQNMLKYNSEIIKSNDLYYSNYIVLLVSNSANNNFVEFKFKNNETLFQSIVTISKYFKLNPLFSALESNNSNNTNVKDCKFNYKLFYKTLKDLKINNFTKFLVISEGFIDGKHTSFLTEDSSSFKENIKNKIFKIFSKYSVDGKMYKDNCKDYIYYSTYNNHFVKREESNNNISDNDDRLVMIYNAYDKDNKGYFIFEDFLSFYYDSYNNKLNLLLDNLKYLGYKKNFKKISNHKEIVDNKDIIGIINNDDFIINLFNHFVSFNNVTDNYETYVIIKNIVNTLFPFKDTIISVLNCDNSFLNFLSNEGTCYFIIEYYFRILFLLLFYDYNSIIKYIRYYFKDFEDDFNKLYKNFIPKFESNNVIIYLLNIIKNSKYNIYKQLNAYVIDIIYSLFISQKYCNNYLKDVLSLKLYKNYFKITNNNEFDKKEIVTNNSTIIEEKISNINKLFKEITVNITQIIPEIFNYIADRLDNNYASLENKEILFKLLSIIYIEIKENKININDLTTLKQIYNILVKGLTINNNPYVFNLFKNFFSIIFLDSCLDTKEFLLNGLITEIKSNNTADILKLINFIGDIIAYINVNNIKINTDFKLVYNEVMENIKNIVSSDSNDSDIKSYIRFLSKIITFNNKILLEMDSNTLNETFKFFVNNFIFNNKEKTIISKYKDIIKEIYELLITFSSSLIKMGMLLIVTVITPILKLAPKLTAFNYNYKHELRSDLKYLGIKNLGCICYMNSMIQQFFCIKPFRYSIIMANNEYDYEPNIINNETFIDDTFFQFRKMFAYMEKSKRKYYNPKHFCLSYKDMDGKPVNVMIQQDAQEFLNMLFDKIEKGIKTSLYRPIFDNTFLGETAHIFECLGCGYIRRKPQIFYNLSLEVKNIPNIEQSFKKLISEEIISDYTCDECNKKCNIKKRMYILTPPNYLIIHLQRIIFDLEFFVNVKVNSHFSFPDKLNIKDFCVDSDGNLDDEYEYVLKGVTCHNGNADFGHYYSYINTSESVTKKIDDWLLFDDANISKFDYSKKEEEWFGTQDNNFDNFDIDSNYNYYGNDKGVNVNTNKSAYLVVYEKILKNKTKFDLSEKNETDKELILKSLNNRSAENDSNVITADYNDIELTHVPSYFLTDIENDNREIDIENFVYNETFIIFCNELLASINNIENNIKPEDNKYIEGYHKMGVEFGVKVYLNVISHTHITIKLNSYKTNMINLIQKISSVNCEKIFNDSFCYNSNQILNIIINNGDSEIKYNLIIILQNIVKNINNPEENIGDNLSSFINDMLAVAREMNIAHHKLVYIFMLYKKLAKFKNIFIYFYNFTFVNYFYNYYVNYKSNNNYNDNTLNECLGFIYNYSKAVSLYNLDKNCLSFLVDINFYKKVINENYCYNNYKYIKLILEQVCYNNYDFSVHVINLLLANLTSSYNINDYKIKCILSCLNVLVNINDCYATKRIQLVIGVQILNYKIRGDTVCYGLAMDNNILSKMYEFKNIYKVKNKANPILNYIYSDRYFDNDKLTEILVFIFDNFVNNKLFFDYIMSLKTFEITTVSVIESIITKAKGVSDKNNILKEYIDNITVNILPQYYKDNINNYNYYEQNNYKLALTDNYIFGVCYKSELLLSFELLTNVSIKIERDYICYTDYYIDKNSNKNNRVSDDYLSYNRYIDNDKVLDSNFGIFINKDNNNNNENKDLFFNNNLTPLGEDDNIQSKENNPNINNIIENKIIYDNTDLIASKYKDNNDPYNFYFRNDCQNIRISYTNSNYSYDKFLLKIKVKDAKFKEEYDIIKLIQSNKTDILLWSFIPLSEYSIQFELVKIVNRKQLQLSNINYTIVKYVKI